MLRWRAEERVVEMVVHCWARIVVGIVEEVAMVVDLGSCIVAMR